MCLSLSLANNIMLYAICYMLLLLFIRRPFHVNYFSSSFCYHKQDCHLHTTYIRLCSLVQCTAHITVLPHPLRLSAEKGEGNFHWSRAECLTKLFINTGRRVNKETRDIHNLINSESSLKEEAQGTYLPCFICVVFCSYLPPAVPFVLVSPPTLSFTLSLLWSHEPSLNNMCWIIPLIHIKSFST